MLKILMVDDTKSVHTLIKGFLSQVPGAQFTSVYNGSDAVGKLKETKDFDLILLDWEMPVMNGPDTLKEFKKMGITIPILMSTTRNSPQDLQTVMDLGISEYMMKPFTKDILISKIEMVTGRSLTNAA